MAKFGTIEVYEEMARLSTDVDSRPYSLVGFGWDE
jgi:hypothetical protein